jgi:acyl dehydratase
MSERVPPAPAWSYGPVTRTDIVRYQGASGDFNPIHHDDAVAQRVGYATAFAPGMLQAGLLASYASLWLGGRGLRGFAVRFREQVWPGDVLDFSGEVTGVEATEDGEVATVALECRRQTGAAVVTAVARFALDHGRPAHDDVPAASARKDADR